jgi:hypothetical protein
MLRAARYPVVDRPAHPFRNAKICPVGCINNGVPSGVINPHRSVVPNAGARPSGTVEPSQDLLPSGYAGGRHVGRVAPQPSSLLARSRAAVTPWAPASRLSSRGDHHLRTTFRTKSGSALVCLRVLMHVLPLESRRAPRRPLEIPQPYWANIGHRCALVFPDETTSLVVYRDAGDAPRRESWRKRCQRQRDEHFQGGPGL